MTVATTSLEQAALYPERSAPATVVSMNETAVAAQIDARVVEVPVRVGDVIEKETVLAQLECTDYSLARRVAKARVDNLMARLELARRRVERTGKLRAGNSVSEDVLDGQVTEAAALAADLEGSRAAFEQARADESRCELRAPFRAAVSRRTAAVGQFAREGAELFRLVDLDGLEVSAQVAVEDVEVLEQVGVALFESGAGEQPVRVRAVVPAVITETRNREVRLQFEDRPALAGSAGRILWRDTRPHIPGELLVERKGRLGVFIVEGGKARFHALPAAQAGRATPTALPPATILITRGHHALEDGADVITAPERP
jgi:RND family efflux transporter MFP subunit